MVSSLFLSYILHMKIEYAQLNVDLYDSIFDWDKYTVCRVMSKTKDTVKLKFDNEIKSFSKKDFTKNFKKVDLSTGDMITLSQSGKDIMKDLFYYAKEFPLEKFSEQLVAYSKVISVNSLKEKPDYYIINDNLVVAKTSVQIEVHGKHSR